MCGRIAISTATDELISEYVAQGGDFRDWRPSWNIKPTQTILVFSHCAKSEAANVCRLKPVSGLSSYRPRANSPAGA